MSRAKWMLGLMIAAVADRGSSDKARAELGQAQKEIKSLRTANQEARLVLMGLLE